MRDIAVGQVFAGHRIEAVAGRGGMGVVYRATQLDLNRPVALKVIAPGLMADAVVRQRFLRESRVAASLEHPNVVPIHYAGDEDGMAYIVMRFVDGDDLRQLIGREGRLPPVRAAALVAQVAAALDAAHAAGLVHRDVKPANVLVAPGDHVYLTDFGLTKRALSVGADTGTGLLVGTPDYVAPEQIRGERVDARTDIYALGCLLYYVLTRRLPFPQEGQQAKLWAHLSTTPPAVSATTPDVPPAFDEVIRRALAKRPDDRYPSAGDLGRAAVAAAHDEQVTETGERAVARGAAAASAAALEPRTAAMPQSGEAGRPTTGPKRRHALIAALAVAVLGAAVVAVLALGDGGKEPPPPSLPAEIRVLDRPNAVALAGGRVWVGGFTDPRLTAIDPDTQRELTRPGPAVGVGVTDLAAGEGALWAAVARERQVVRVDPGTGRATGRPIAIEGTPLAIATGQGDVWLAVRDPGPGPDGKLVRIDPERRRVTATIPLAAGIANLVVTGSGVWVLRRRPSEVIQVRPGTRRLRRVRLGGSDATDIAHGGGALWATVPDRDEVARVDERTLDFASIAVGDGPAGVAVLGDDVWVANRRDSTLSRLDAETGRANREPLPVPLNPFAVVAGDGWLWVTCVGANAVQPVPDGF